MRRRQSARCTYRLTSKPGERAVVNVGSGARGQGVPCARLAQACYPTQHKDTRRSVHRLPLVSGAAPTSEAGHVLTTRGPRRGRCVGGPRRGPPHGLRHAREQRRGHEGGVGPVRGGRALRRRVLARPRGGRRGRRVAAAKCVKAAAKRAPAFRGALAKKGGIAPLVAMAETAVEAPTACPGPGEASPWIPRRTRRRSARAAAWRRSSICCGGSARPRRWPPASLRNYEGEALRERISSLAWTPSARATRRTRRPSSSPVWRRRTSGQTATRPLVKCRATTRWPCAWLPSRRTIYLDVAGELARAGRGRRAEALAAAVDDHLRDGPSGPRGLHDDDGRVPPGNVTLLPPKSGAKRQKPGRTQAVCEHLNKKLNDDKAGRAMRLRDHAGRAGVVRESVRGERAPSRRRRRRRLCGASRGTDGARAAPAASRRRRTGCCVWGTGAESVLQLACVGDNTASILRTAGAVAALEKLKSETDGRLREAVRGAEHHLALGLIRSNSPIKSHSSKRYDVFLSAQTDGCKRFCARVAHDAYIKAAQGFFRYGVRRVPGHAPGVRGVLERLRLHPVRECIGCARGASPSSRRRSIVACLWWS